MTRWIRHLFRSTPDAILVHPKCTRLGLQRLEERDTPATFTVTNTADSGAGSLRDAIAQANATSGADTITFAPDLGPVVLTTEELLLTDATGATTISGPSGGTQAVHRSAASGTPNFRIIEVAASVSAAFNNLTFNNGNTDSGGGGIFNQGTLTVTNATIEGNRASDGFGGGISNRGTLTVINSAVLNNAATNSGGGIVNDATLTVTNSTISDNITNVNGGGIMDNGVMALTNVTITGNTGDFDRSGDGTGGGLYTSVVTATLNNTLVANNFVVSIIDSLRRIYVPDDVKGAVAGTSANNLIGDGTGLTGITNGSGRNQIGTAAAPIDPLLLPLANNGGLTKTHALGQNSPALGSGSAIDSTSAEYDQRGASRDTGNADIGAYEVNHPLSTVGAPTTLAGLYQPKPSATANEAFVKGLYQSTLLRAPDAAGLSGWLAALAGGTSRDVVANGFVNSVENRRNQVTFFYRYFLSREPDTAGLNGWVDILRSGTDEGQVMTGFILSNEFSGQNNNSQFVNLMYYALLSRQADAAGFNGWVNALNAGESRGNVVNAFLRSVEGLNRVVDGLFAVYLKRYGTAGDLSAFRTFLNSNTFGQAATLILGSEEFFVNAGNNL